MMDNRSVLASVMTELKGQDTMPKRIDLSKIGNRYWCVVSDAQIDSISVMNEDVSTGFSHEKEIAVLKALSERAERNAFRNGAQASVLACQTERSDGFAAMPSGDSSKARLNALSEAIERYAWSYWWDHSEVEFKKEEIEASHQLVENSLYLQEAFKLLNLEKIIRIEPFIANSNQKVQILFGKIKNLGFVSGGACGDLTQTKDAFLRAFDELYRHGFAYNRALQKQIEPASFYEKRLFHFASGKGNTVVEDRINKIGTEKIVLPILKIDRDVTSPFNGFAVHRCYFENQPPFVGGDLERLCL